MSNIHADATVNIAGILNTDIDDHFPIFIHCALKSSSASGNIPLLSWNYSEQNIIHFASCLSSADWSDILQANDTNYASIAFKRIFSQI